MSARTLPALVHVRPPGAGLRGSLPPSGPPSSGKADAGVLDVSARTMAVDELRRELQAGNLPRDTEVLFPGLGDWTPASEVAELWTATPVVVAAADADEPLRPSIPVSSSSTAPRKRSFGAAAVIGSVFAAIALLGVGAAAIYFVYFHYKPVAIRHLPGLGSPTSKENKCVVTARVDLLDWAFFDPLSKKLAPAIDQATHPPPPPGPQPPPPPSLKDRLKATAGVDIDRGDVREIAACAFQDKSIPAGTKDPLLGYRAVIAIGGRFKGGLVPKLFDAMQIELKDVGARLDGNGDSALIRVLPSPATGGVAAVLGQAEDGTILIAPNDVVLANMREAKPEEEAHASTGLKQQGAFELAADAFVFRSVFGYTTPPTPAWEPIFKSLSAVDQGWFAIETGKSPRISVSLDQKSDSSAKDTETALRKVLELAKRELETVPKDWAGEHAAIGTARVLRDDTRVDVKLEFPYRDVDRGADDVSAQLKDPASPLRTLTLPKVGIVLPGTVVPAAPAPSASASAPEKSPGKPTPDDE